MYLQKRGDSRRGCLDYLCVQDRSHKKQRFVAWLAPSSPFRHLAGSNFARPLSVVIVADAFRIYARAPLSAPPVA